MVQTYRVRIKDKGILYLPVDVRGRLGVDKGGELLLIVEKDKVVLKPVKTIFRYAIETENKVEISVGEFENESEEMQEELYGG